MPGPIIPDPTPDWLKPENASVFDSSLERTVKFLATLIGADDPQSQAFAITGAPKVGRVGKAGARIARGAQSSLDDALKIPRFRSPHGTFLKYEGEWWRLKPNSPTATEMELEWFGKGEKATERLSAGGGPLKRRTVPVQDFVQSVREAKGVTTTPRRRK